MAMPAAIIGFMIVGAFDSLIDNVRVAVLFFLLCMVALLKPRPAGPRVGMVRR
jgi:hypothetical protein